MEVSVVVAYMVSFVTLIVLFLANVLIANLINYKSDHSDESSRKIWFWVLGVLTLVVAFCVNFYISTDIDVPSQRSDYLLHSGISAAISFVLFIVVGFVLTKIFSNGKISSWF